MQTDGPPCTCTFTLLASTLVVLDGYDNERFVTARDLGSRVDVEICAHPAIPEAACPAVG